MSRLHPFPGLRPFQAGEEDLFFGREGQSEEILRRLRESHFLAVVGASGSGKSSLIRAGLLPYLHGGFMVKAGSHWRTAIFRPGSDPIGNLARALNDQAALGSQDEDAARNAILLEVTLRRSGLGLIEAIRLARLPAHENILIIVDQFEELFRFADAASAVRREDDAAAFVKLLLEASAENELPIYVVLAMRSDFIGDCARFQDLPEAVTAGLYLIPRMTREQRRAAIEEPVAIANAEISRRLVNRLLNDVGDNPDQLPTLQHALMRTWDYWTKHHEGQPIDLEDYTNIGTMAKALSIHADEAYDELPGEREKRIAKRLFQCLTERGPDNREVRRPTTVAEIAGVAGATTSEVIAVIEYFRRPDRSFLMPPDAVALDANSIIDISHESLIRGWERLRGWVEEESESAKVYRRLAETAALHAKGEANLWRDPELLNALTWRTNRAPNASWAKRYNSGFDQAMAFLDKSREVRDAEIANLERRRLEDLRRWRWYSGAITVALLLALSGIGIAWREKKQADANADRYKTETARAESERTHAENERKNAENEAARAEGEQKKAEKARVDLEKMNLDLREAQRLAVERNRALIKADKLAKDEHATAKQGLAGLVKSLKTVADFQRNLKQSEDLLRTGAEIIKAVESRAIDAASDPEVAEAVFIAYVGRGDQSVQKGTKSHQLLDYARADADYLIAKALAERQDASTLNGRYNRMVVDERAGFLCRSRAMEMIKEPEEKARVLRDALSFHTRSLQQNSEWAKTDHSAGRMRSMAISEYNVGRDLVLLRRHEDAKPHYQAQIDFYRKSSELEPATSVADDLASSYTELANLEYSIGLEFFQKKAYENARSHYQSQIDLYQKSAAVKASTSVTRQIVSAYQDLSSLENAAGNFTEARRIIDLRIGTLKPLVEGKTAAVEDKNRMARAYHSRSWYDLFLGEYFTAVADVDNGLSFDDKQILILTNKAHALLFLGKTEDAYTIYQDYADKLADPEDPKSRTFRQAVLEDFVEFRKYPKMTVPALDDMEKRLTRSDSRQLF
jgi:ABC-type oligopeptide transport system ATPase subunit